MPPGKDWRTPADETGNDALQYSDIAIGYLSRNLRYRADYARALSRVKRGAVSADEATAALVRRWGISFHAAPPSAYDPKLAVAQADLSPASVILAPAPADLGTALRLDLKMLGAVRACMTLGGLLHFILADPDGDAHVWVSGSLDKPLAMMLPIGADLIARLASAERLRRRLLGIATGPPALRPPPFRLQHLLTLLRVLDGREAGASRRELAAALIDGGVTGYSAAEWVECRERKRIGRWTTEALELRDGGYVRLLRGG